VTAEDGTLVLFGDSDSVSISSAEEGARFLLVSGKPLRESIAWRGPIVMNIQEELRAAWRELGEGSLVKRGAPCLCCEVTHSGYHADRYKQCSV